jgi:hypothetical protein
MVVRSTFYPISIVQLSLLGTTIGSTYLKNFLYKMLKCAAGVDPKVFDNCIAV